MNRFVNVNHSLAGPPMNLPKPTILQSTQTVWISRAPLYMQSERLTLIGLYFYESYILRDLGKDNGHHGPSKTNWTFFIQTDDRWRLTATFLNIINGLTLVWNEITCHFANIFFAFLWSFLNNWSQSIIIEPIKSIYRPSSASFTIDIGLCRPCNISTSTYLLLLKSWLTWLRTVANHDRALFIEDQ